MSKLNVLYTVDNKYVDFMLASALSLIENGNAEGLKIHIITSGFAVDDYNRIEAALCKYPNIEVYFYDIKNYDLDKFKIPAWRGVQIPNARLFFQDILRDNVNTMENLLYLDSDVIVVSDLNSLSEYNANAINAVKDGIDLRHIQYLGISQYFNSGVLYFNVDKWINSSMQDQVVHFFEQNRKILTYPDQDAINCAFEGEIAEMPLNYNLGANAYLFDPKLQSRYFGKNSNISNEEIEEAKRNPKILHGIGVLDIKPWTNNHANPYNEIFMQYILKANPNFQKTEIGTLQKLLTMTPEICAWVMVMKKSMPTNIKTMARKLIRF
ncbi:MAG: glycosyltransferase family 8 protein [Firmicutes bacterium]|nr:glycosyltransferase family 8 protein [Bacillota bacterium]